MFFFSVRFHDKLAVDFENSQACTIKVQVYGQDTTIVSNTPIIPTIELEHHFR